MRTKYDTDAEPLQGTYEVSIVFGLTGESEPQYITISFQVTKEMEEDLPFEDDFEERGAEYAEEQKERWVVNNLDVLLDMDLIDYVSGNDEIEDVEEFQEKFDAGEIRLSYY